MKTLLIWLITFYQIFISPIFHIILGPGQGCRYETSCSVYAKQSIEKYGALKGSALALKRLSACHPFAKIDR